MVEKGVKFTEDVADKGCGDCETVLRSVFADATGCVNIYNGQVHEGPGSGVSITCPFEIAGREQGVDYMMNRHMDALIQDETGRVIGIRASYTPRLEHGYFFRGETLEELAANIVNKYYEDYPMDPETLVATVERYNELVDKGEDEDFGKPSDLMTVKIKNGPFYAAWVVPCMHDCLVGLRTNGKRQVLTVGGEVIPGLYAAGECSGCHRTHGLGKVQTAGYIAGLYASQE